MLLRKKHFTPLLLVAGLTSFWLASRPGTVVGRDSNRDRPTAEAPVRENRTDATAADQIRALLAEDPSLSAEAKNVKVVLNKGNVFLRGAVASAEEKEKVVSIVKQVSRSAKVDNDLEIRAPATLRE